jgi:2-hydroxychromene-2-carboxylate isomerase
MDFFFSCASTYTYLSVMRIEKLAEAAGVTVRWRPFNLGEITREQNNRPFVGKPVKMKYMWRDLERRAAQHQIPFAGVPPYPVDADRLAHRVALLAAQEGWCPQLAKALYQQWFIGHKDPGDPVVLRDVLTTLGKDAGTLLAQADSQETARQLSVETDVARQLGIFGSPTFVVDREIFWGDDRLEAALDWSTNANWARAAAVNTATKL